LAIEAKVQESFVIPLVNNGVKEVALALEHRETRPLWRWLAAIGRLVDVYPHLFPADLSGSLQNADRAIVARPDVDPGGECKTAIYAVLEKLKAASPVSAEAWALSGSFESSVIQLIRPIGYARITSRDRHSEARQNGFQFGRILSAATCYSEASGSVSDKTDTRVISVSSIIEGLNILDVLTADKVVAQVSIHYREGEPEPIINFSGTRFVKLRIVGNLCEVTFDFDSAQQIFHRETKAPPSSLVTKIRGRVPDRVIGNVLEVPDFGTISLAELAIDSNSVQFTMIRCKFAGLLRGSLEVGICRAGTARGPNQQAK
jgi:hypothetical protein